MIPRFLFVALGNRIAIFCIREHRKTTYENPFHQPAPCV